MVVRQVQGGGNLRFRRGISWETSLRFPPVGEIASGMPCPSTNMWCLLPGRARSTGLDPLLGLAERPAHGRRQSRPATSPAVSPLAALPTAHRGAGPRRQPRSRPQADASMSCPNRSPSPAAGTFTGSPVCSTNRIILGRPSTSFGAGLGKNGSISDHGSSEATHRRDSLFPTNNLTSIQVNSHSASDFCIGSLSLNLSGFLEFLGAAACSGSSDDRCNCRGARCPFAPVPVSESLL